MSGAVAAHAAYNGSGTQGLAVTNKIQDEESDVTSVFWNKNDTTRQLLHGSTILEVPASGNSGNIDYGGSRMFTVNNDIDNVGELYVNLSVGIQTGELAELDAGGGSTFATAFGDIPLTETPKPYSGDASEEVNMGKNGFHTMEIYL